MSNQRLWREHVGGAIAEGAIRRAQRKKSEALVLSASLDVEVSAGRQQVDGRTGVRGNEARKASIFAELRGHRGPVRTEPRGRVRRDEAHEAVRVDVAVR